MDSRRIASIDGLRTIAILAVVAFHYCYRWGPPLNSGSLYPYGTALADLPGVRFGGCGVQLFFVISGFVIAMTLDRCRTPREFVVRRYARLGPAMLVFSVITFAAMHVIPRAPFPERGVWFLSAITFIDPQLLNRSHRVSASIASTARTGRFTSRSSSTRWHASSTSRWIGGSA